MHTHYFSHSACFVICHLKCTFTATEVTVGISTVLIYPLKHQCTHNHSRERPLGYYCYNTTHHMTTSQWNPNVTLSADKNRWQEHSRNDPIKQGKKEKSIQPASLWQSMAMRFNPRRMTPRRERWRGSGRGRRSESVGGEDPHRLHWSSWFYIWGRLAGHTSSPGLSAVCHLVKKGIIHQIHTIYNDRLGHETDQ